MSHVRDNKISDINIVFINDNNREVFINLAHAYEAEFSNLTNKIPNENGIFEPDTLPVKPYIGYLLYKTKTPIGFCVAEINDEVNDMAEFYIIPSMRKNKFGYRLAITMFEMHPGKWQIRQIEGATIAKEFWRRVITTYTQDEFVETLISDSDWGMVTCQQFSTNVKRSFIANETEHLQRFSLFPTLDESVEGKPAVIKINTNPRITQ